MLDCSVFEFRSWENSEGELRDDQAQSFGIKEEEQLVLANGAAQRTCPLIRVKKRTRLAIGFDEPVVRNKKASTTLKLRIDVDIIAA